MTEIDETVLCTGCADNFLLGVVLILKNCMTRTGSQYTMRQFSIELGNQPSVW